MTSETRSVPSKMHQNDEHGKMCETTSPVNTNNNGPPTVPLADIEDLDATSSDNDSKSDDPPSGHFRSRNPASRLMGSFRKLVRKTKERTSFRKSKHKNDSSDVKNSPKSKTRTIDVDKQTGVNKKDQTGIKHIDCMGSDINIADNQTYKRYRDPSDVIEEHDDSTVSDEGLGPLCQRTEQLTCVIKESTGLDCPRGDSNTQDIEPHRTNVNSQNPDYQRTESERTNSIEPDRTTSEHTQSKCTGDTTSAMVLPELQSVSSGYSSPNEIVSSDESPRNSITTSESNCSVKDSGNSSPTLELLDENHVEVAAAPKSVIRRFSARIHNEHGDAGNLLDARPCLDQSNRPRKSKHKHVAFAADDKPSVDLNCSYSLSEVDSNSSFGSIPIDNESLSGSETSSGGLSFPGSVQSRDVDTTPTPSDVVTNDNRRHSGRFDTCRRRPTGAQRRLRHVTESMESFRRVLPAYSIDTDSAYKVGFASRTWDVMRQGFRVALGGDSGFVCDHFLGRDVAMGVVRELRAMRDGRLFERHMVRDPRKPSLKYSCVFLLEQRPCHTYIDTMVLMLYKLARYYASNWTKVSVELSYFPRGHGVQTVPITSQGDDRKLLKCVYFPQINRSHLNSVSEEDVIQNGGVLTLQTPRVMRVEPMFDRLVAFWGDSFEHTVSSTRGETFSVTVWLQR